MGIFFSKKKHVSRVTEQDKAVLVCITMLLSLTSKYIVIYNQLNSLNFTAIKANKR